MVNKGVKASNFNHIKFTFHKKEPKKCPKTMRTISENPRLTEKVL